MRHHLEGSRGGKRPFRTSFRSFSILSNDAICFCSIKYLLGSNISTLFLHERPFWEHFAILISLTLPVFSLVFFKSNPD